MAEGSAEWLRHAGQWAGWLGAGLLSASLLLMIREPDIARVFGGLERMYLWHHRLGMTAYVVLLVHPLALAGAVLPYGVEGAWSAVSPVHSFPANALGWLALLGLVLGLAATFVWRLSYGVWRNLHRLLGMAVLLAFVHVFAYRGPALGALALALPALLALGWRIVRTDRGGAARPYEVASVDRLPHIAEVTLRPLAAPLSAAPGQFVMAAFFEGPHFRGCGEFHPYTVSGSRPDGTIMLAIKELGDCTRNIQSLERGVAARVQGPFGTFLQKREGRKAVWIAGGIGITPFVAALRAGEVAPETELIYAYRNAQEAPYLPELLERFARAPELHFHGLELQEDLRPLHAKLDGIEALSSRDVHLCGPAPMVEALVHELRARGVPQAQLHSERFDFRP